MPQSGSSKKAEWLYHRLPRQTVWGTETDQERQKAGQAMLSTERSNGRFQQSLYELFSEMEEKDGHLFSLIQTRVNAITGLDWQLHGHGDEKSSEAQGFVNRALRKFPRFREFMKALLDALSKGFAVVELVWDYDEDGRFIVTDWVAHPQEYFAFDDHGELNLLKPPFGGRSQEGDHAVRGDESSVNASGARSIKTPANKFIVHGFGRDARNPFGRGLCQRAYWYYWFKKNTLRSWSLFNEKYGAPLAVARVDQSVTDVEKNALLEVLDSIQTDAGVVVPESIQLSFLEAARNGDGDSFRALADWCNDEMSRIVLGATLTSGEGRRSGSMALGEIHNDVRQDYLVSDMCALENVLNETLIKWLVDLNFHDSVPPELKFDASESEDLDQQIRIDRELIRLGVPLSVDELYRRYGRHQPMKDEATLAFDDANVFQYHLRFGILTVNEVRKRLQLPPVDWGDRPTSLVAGGIISEESGGGERDGDDLRTELPEEERNEESRESEQ